MNRKMKIAFGCYLAAIVIIASLALTYLFTPQLLSYQEQAVGVSWSQLQPGFKTQFLSLLKVSGGGYLSTAIALAILLFIPFKQNENWARIAIAALGSLAVLIVNYAGLTLMLNTPSRPPLIAGPITIALLIAGFILSSGIKKRKETKISETVGV
ncbi:MAG: hypothetical protein KME17_19055 [Cyanosarcina radialis HA8281-LM2]|jgi:hypothetical protein|nr:hypothetical protein [Cyanosarcina radialis HA8281-LM2]